MDDWDNAGAARLMHPDGVWLRRGVALRGPDAVLAAIETRSRTRVAYHLITNLVVDRLGDREERVRAYLLLVGHDGDIPLNGAAPLPGIGAIALLDAQLSREPEGWRIKRMERSAPS
jgi:hypothetical protein